MYLYDNQLFKIQFFKILSMFFHYSLLSPIGKGHDPSFEHFNFHSLLLMKLCAMFGMDDKQQLVIRKAHLNFQLRWTNNELIIADVSHLSSGRVEKP